MATHLHLCTAAACLLLTIGCTGVWGQGDTPLPRNPLPCLCTDVAARVSWDSVVEYGCYDQFKFGSCSQPFMLNSIEEVPEGYCQISCGRCKCCKPVTEVMKEWNVEEFRWAVTQSSYGAELKNPGWEGVLLAPRDPAVSAYFDKIGLTKEAVEGGDSSMQAQLDGFVSVHILPPLDYTRAVWTQPFMLSGTSLPTQKNGTALEVQDVDDGRVTLRLGNSSAKIMHADVYFCKGFINVLDKVLTDGDSSEGSSEAPVDLSALSKEMPGECNVDPNTYYEGDVVTEGKDNIQKSAWDCCSSCDKQKACNVWVWCAKEDGCTDGSGAAHEGHSCELKYQKSVALGSYAQGAYRGKLVPFASGLNRNLAKAAGR